MKKKYILVEWPESQDFIGREDCYFVDAEDLGSSAYFVPEELYQQFINGALPELEEL